MEIFPPNYLANTHHVVNMFDYCPRLRLRQYATLRTTKVGICLNWWQYLLNVNTAFIIFIKTIIQ